MLLTSGTVVDSTGSVGLGSMPGWLGGLTVTIGPGPASIPESDDPVHRLEPLCAVYGPKCVDPIRKQIVDEDFRMTGFLNSVDTVKLSFGEISEYGDPATIFFNVTLLTT